MIALSTRLLAAKAFFMPPAWFAELRSLGRIQGDTLFIESDALTAFQERHAFRGLGDLVSLAAQPIAKTFDATLGTDLANCPGCDGRKEGLNDASTKVMAAAKAVLGAILPH